VQGWKCGKCEFPPLIAVTAHEDQRLTNNDCKPLQHELPCLYASGVACKWCTHSAMQMTATDFDLQRQRVCRTA
jgi:hypothetical protein